MPSTLDVRVACGDFTRYLKTFPVPFKGLKGNIIGKVVSASFDGKFTIAKVEVTPGCEDEFKEPKRQRLVELWEEPTELVEVPNLEAWAKGKEF